MPLSHHFSILLVALSVALLSLSAFAEDPPQLKSMIETHGAKYLESRDAFLREGKDIVPNGDDPRFALLAEILAAHKAYPQFFKDLAQKAEEAAARPHGRPEMEQPNIWLGMDAARIMRQGIEMKEYATLESPTGLARDITEIKHTQADEEVAEIKRRNRAARLAVIEYLWKISEDWRITYELLDVFDFHYGPNTYQPIEQGQLLAFSDIFITASHYLVLEVCANIFIKYKYDAILPLARKKLSSYREDIDIGNYRNCLTLSRLLTELGDENDRRLVESLKPRLEELRKPYEAVAEKERDARIREWEQREEQRLKKR